MKNITDVYANNYTLMLFIPEVKYYLYNTQFKYLYNFTVKLVRLALPELKWSKQWYFFLNCTQAHFSLRYYQINM